MPQLAMSRSGGTVTLPDGGAMAIPGVVPAALGDAYVVPGHRLLVVLTIRRMDVDALANAPE
jgi:hypothetical protein